MLSHSNCDRESRLRTYRKHCEASATRRLQVRFIQSVRILIFNFVSDVWPKTHTCMYQMACLLPNNLGLSLRILPSFLWVMGAVTHHLLRCGEALTSLTVNGAQQAATGAVRQSQKSLPVFKLLFFIFLYPAKQL